MLKIHREGRVALLITAIFIITINYAIIKITKNEYMIYGGIAISVIIYFAIMFLFRITNRPLIDDGNAIVAPCDGRIQSIDNVNEDVFLRGNVTRIRIKTTFLNVHMKWFPVNGKIIQSFTQTENNKQCVFVLFETENQSKILIKTIPSTKLGNAKNYAHEGKYAEQNDHMGFTGFGSTTEIFIPNQSDLRIVSKQTVKGTQTVLARFKA